jgi:hypothetical protein
MPDRKAPPPSALAHGPTKSSDIERVRKDVERATVKVAQDDRAVAAQRLREAKSAGEPKQG